MHPTILQERPKEGRGSPTVTYSRLSHPASPQSTGGSLKNQKAHKELRGAARAASPGLAGVGRGGSRGGGGEPLGDPGAWTHSPAILGWAGGRGWRRSETGGHAPPPRSAHPPAPAHPPSWGWVGGGARGVAMPRLHPHPVPPAPQRRPGRAGGRGETEAPPLRLRPSAWEPRAGRPALAAKVAA